MMRINRYPGMAALLVLALIAGSYRATSQEKPSARELPRAIEIPGVKPEVLARTEVPGAPGKAMIVARTTYQPGARVRKHYHTSQVTFYILEGRMIVQDEGKEPVTLKAGDFLLIKPGTVHAHWNASTTAPLVFLEHVIVDQDQRSAVFME
jgi:quercetin dioxygenase-like cupin family protein